MSKAKFYVTTYIYANDKLVNDFYEIRGENAAHDMIQKMQAAGATVTTSNNLTRNDTPVWYKAILSGDTITTEIQIRDKTYSDKLNRAFASADKPVTANFNQVKH